MRIVYIDVDSLRPDHMGCYGYERNTTPNIDRIAQQGARFNHAYCAASPCVPSRANFTSARYAANNGALTHWGAGCDFEGSEHSPRYPLVPRYLRKAGYKTVTFSSFGDRHEARWYLAGWNEVHTHTLKGGAEDAHEVNPHVIHWLKQHGKEDNYFLHIQYWDPHTHYTAPREYIDQFKNQPVKAFPDELTISEHRNMSHPKSASFLHWRNSNPSPETMPDEVKDRSDVEMMINGFDGGISYMDKHVGELLDTFKELGIEDEVCYILSADHGESFGEQGIYLEHGMATESVHHIPLIMKMPGITKPGTVVDDMVYNVDVMSTVADVLGLEIPKGWDGVPFTNLLKGEAWQGHDYIVLEHGLYCCQRAVFDGRWWFIRTYHEGFYEFPRVVLYDMHDDPFQEHNVAGQHPEIVHLMDHRINEWMQSNIDKHDYMIDPMTDVLKSGGPFRYIKLDRWLNRLREEGWDKRADELEAKLKVQLYNYDQR